MSNGIETIMSSMLENEDNLLAFADLCLSEEQNNEIKGGTGCGWNCPTCTSGRGNHNETLAEDDAQELNDLTVSDDAEIVGGPLKRIRIGVMSFGEEGAE